MRNQFRNPPVDTLFTRRITLYSKSASGKEIQFVNSRFSQYFESFPRDTQAGRTMSEEKSLEDFFAKKDKSKKSKKSKTKFAKSTTEEIAKRLTEADLKKERKEKESQKEKPPPPKETDDKEDKPKDIIGVRFVSLSL